MCANVEEELCKAEGGESQGLRTNSYDIQAHFYPVSLLGLVKPGVFCRLLGSSRHYLK